MNKTCLKCGKSLNRWAKKFCSKICQGKAQKGENSPHWKGDDIGYWGIHDWLYTNYGSADKCENKNCLGTASNKFQWAKLHSKPYERRRENFIMLCIRCHVLYDETVPCGWNKGIPHTKEIREKISRTLKNKNK
jgi:hypothetical protein